MNKDKNIEDIIKYINTSAKEFSARVELDDPERNSVLRRNCDLCVRELRDPEKDYKNSELREFVMSIDEYGIEKALNDKRMSDMSYIYQRYAESLSIPASSDEEFLENFGYILAEIERDAADIRRKDSDFQPENKEEICFEADRIIEEAEKKCGILAFNVKEGSEDQEKLVRSLSENAEIKEIFSKRELEEKEKIKEENLEEHPR